MKILLKIILTISLITLTISIITQNVVVTTLKNEIVASKILKTVTIILSILSTFILVILEKKKVVKTLSHISLILSLTSLIMYITISLATNYIDQNIMGGLLNQINVSLPLKLFIILLIASIILQVLNKTILKEN